MDSSLYFGIDGGGTRSRIALVDAQLRRITAATAGSTNIYSVSPEEVRKNLQELFAVLPISSVAGGCIGSAGLAREHEHVLFSRMIGELLPDIPVKLCSDGEILLCGGLQGTQGYALVCGTGSLALSRTKDGRLRRSGGYGYMLGDEGSAWWIGHQSLVRSLRSTEGRDLPTSMLADLLRACHVDKADELVAYVHHKAAKADIGALAPIVTQHALNGDRLAADILRQAAEELLALVISVQNPEIANNELVLAGGVMEHDRVVTEQLKELIAANLPHLNVITPRGTALDGACILAREHAGR